MNERTEKDLEKVPPQLREGTVKLIEQKSKGLGTRYKQKPVSLLLPPEIDCFVRSLPQGERSDWLRAAVMEKYQQEKGLS